MTIYLDLTKRYDLMRQGRTVLSADPFQCADCGRRYQFARELVAHMIEARGDKDHV